MGRKSSLLAPAAPGGPVAGPLAASGTDEINLSCNTAPVPARAR